MKFIYLIKSKDSQLYKIGISTNPHKRLRELQTGNPEELILIYKYLAKNPIQLEKSFHNRYSYLNKINEWFNFDVIIESNFLRECLLIDNNISVSKKIIT